ncbi:hypothetical protein CC1G_14821 [Coprinopsis cinerea okayama7|uniref:Uncharacterized protein n=1 Tax=Coprinopsis cinerea (strain Okayama-7 / 130 / ATCC MYA-4618 / FGSC 9003) TaxID=240176 RepID=D6RNU6_COPC7|nr:hypothetical protein CC1G_14821 [Coprinopsis cinerea okayama7\|eukprot:XP_002910842.1 hypothetical protein CC1G_14821 [Coprinopsis cinerea okayama7\
MAHPVLVSSKMCTNHSHQDIHHIERKMLRMRKGGWSVDGMNASDFEDVAGRYGGRLMLVSEGGEDGATKVWWMSEREAVVVIVVGVIESKEFVKKALGERQGVVTEGRRRSEGCETSSVEPL